MFCFMSYVSTFDKSLLFFASNIKDICRIFNFSIRILICHQYSEFCNHVQVKKKVYTELHVGDVIRFGM